MDLYEVASSGDIEATKNLVRRIGTASIKSLLQAVKEDNVIAIKTLLDAGVDPNINLVKDGRDYVIYSAIGKPIIIKLLLEHKADPNARYYDGRGWRSPPSLLWRAMNKNDVESVRLLLQYGADIEPLNDEYQIYKPEIVKLILDYGANPNYTYSVSYDTYGTYLHKIMQGFEHEYPRERDDDKRKRIVDTEIELLKAYLVERKLKLDTNKPMSRSVKSIWSDKPLPDQEVTYLGMALWLALWSGNYEAVKLLLDHGADPNLPSDGRLPLSIAIFRNNKELVDILLEKGADPNLKLKDKSSPFEDSISNNNTEIAKLFLDFMCERDKNCVGNRCSSETTTCKGNNRNKKINLQYTHNSTDLSNTLKLLLEYGYQPNNITYNEDSILTTIQNVDVMKLFLEQGADPNFGKRKPLQTAYTSENKIELVRLLLEYGADPFVNPGWDLDYYLKAFDGAKEVMDLVNEYRWKRIYQTDKELARKYAQGSSLPKDVWEIILLNKRRDSLCKNLNTDKNKEILFYFALEFGIPVTREMSKAQVCELISKYIVYLKENKK